MNVHLIYVRIVWTLLLGALSLVGCAEPSDSADDGQSPAGAGIPAIDIAGTRSPYSAAGIRDWKAQHGTMCHDLELTEPQQAALQDAFAAGAAKLQAWYEQHADELAQLEQKMLSAARDRDLGGMRRFKSQAETLRNQRQQLKQELDKALADALPDDKRWGWYGQRNAARLLNGQEDLNVTELQQIEIRELATRLVAESSSHRDPEREGYGKLLKALPTQVLTPEQQDAFEKVLETRPLSLMFQRGW